jgi:N-methylhydantoinase A
VQGAHKANRQVFFANEWRDTMIYDRLALPVGAVIEGPAILEQPDTTVLVDPGLKATVDAFGNTIIERVEG